MNESSKSPYHGQCLCGKIKYQVDAIESKMGHCHCSMCRKFHGAAFATFGEARKESFHWLQGEDSLKSFVADNGTVRQFCQNCGSSLTFASDEGQQAMVEFSLGTLDSEISERPDVHIFTGYKASWYDINDDLPGYVDGRKSERIQK